MAGRAPVLPQRLLNGPTPPITGSMLATAGITSAIMGLGHGRDGLQVGEEGRGKWAGTPGAAVAGWHAQLAARRLHSGYTAPRAPGISVTSLKWWISFHRWP